MSIVILGGGLSGLSAAYYLLKLAPKQPITLLEASSRLGGWVKSNVINDILFEEGPRTIRPHGVAAPNTLSLIEDLGLMKQIIPINSFHPAARNRMIYANGELHSLPSSFFTLFKKQKPFSKSLVRFLAQDMFAPKKTVRDESIYDFVNRRFGREMADYLISSLICGICAGNAKEISVNFLMKNLFQYEQQFGSISRGLVRNFIRGEKKKVELGELALKVKNESWNVFSFKGGLETLPKALEDYVRRNSVNVNLNAKCKELDISKNQNNALLVYLDDGHILNGQHVVCSIPAEKLAPLIQKQHPYLSELLDNIKCVTVGVVNLQYNKKLISKEGFGFLVPPKENLPILGVIYDSCCFPSGNNTVLTVMMGGSWFEQLFGKNPDKSTLLQTAKDQLKNTLGISEEPVQFQVNIHEKCIPQYKVGHDNNLERINKYIFTNKLPLSLCGASYYGVGINDVILSARNAIERLL